MFLEYTWQNLVCNYVCKLEKEFSLKNFKPNCDVFLIKNYSSVCLTSINKIRFIFVDSNYLQKENKNLYNHLI